MKEQKIIMEPFEMLDVLECSGQINANNHGHMVIKGYIDKEKEQMYLQMLLNEIWGTIKLCDEAGKETVLFSGIVTRGEIEVQNGLKIITIEMKTGTFLMDLKKHKRSFQNKEITYEKILDIVTESYADKGFVITKGKGQSIKRFFCQYQETDWQFVLRTAKHCHTTIYPNYITKGVKFSFGMPHGKKRGEINVTEYYFEYNDALLCGVKVRELYDIGDKVFFQGRELYVISRATKFEYGELYHIYELSEQETEPKDGFSNENLIGASWEAIVTKVEGTDVSVTFIEDENQRAGGSKWFSFATVYSSSDGTGWYFMPEVGDKVRIYFPSCDEEEAYALNAVHIQATNDNERVNPDYKSLMNKQGKEILFKPDSILITNNAGMSLEISDSSGISIISNKKITFESQEGIEITSVQADIDIVSAQKISLRQGNTNMVLSNQMVMNGPKIRLE